MEAEGAKVAGTVKVTMLPYRGHVSGWPVGGQGLVDLLLA